jgi:hypothetical protein
MSTNNLLPPYTFGERIREIRMRVKAFCWRVRKWRRR